MGLNWNPGFPDQIGVQRLHSGYMAKAVSSPTTQYALTFKALHSGPADFITLYGQGDDSPLPDGSFEYYGNPRPMMLDLYAGDANVGEKIEISTFNPSQVTGSAKMYNDNLTQPVTAARIQAVDSLFHVAANLHAYTRMQFPTSTFDLARRIVNLRFLVRVNGSYQFGREDDFGALGGWSHYFPVSTSTYSNRIILAGEALVDANDIPNWSWWTPQRIRDMRAGGPRSWTVQCKAKPGAWRLDTVRMEVAWQPETRLGVGIASIVGSGYLAFDMATPAATGVPNLVAGQTYTIVLRPPHDDSVFGLGKGKFNWRGLTGKPLVEGWDSVTLKVTSDAPTGSTFSPAPKYYRPTDQSTIPVGLDTLCMAVATGAPWGSPGAAVQETAMPYVLDRGSPIYVGQGVDQRIHLDGAALTEVFGQTGLVVGWKVGSPPAANTRLRVEVWNYTLTERVFSPVERTFADIASQPPVVVNPVSNENIEYRYVRFRHPESLVLPEADYEIRVSSDNATSARPWMIPAMIADVHTPNQTFGRATQFARGIWASSSSPSNPLTGSVHSSDVMFSLMTVPPAVTGVDVSPGIHAAHSTDTCAGSVCGEVGCSDDGAPYAHLEWSKTSDDLSVAYEIQRSSVSDDDAFRTVVFVDGIDNTSWNDEEAPLGGIASSYRIRSVRADDLTGDWSEPVTIRMPSGRVALSFTSNAATGLAVTYNEIWDRETVTREFEFLEYEDVEILPIYGRERQVAFHPLERKGVRMERTLLLNALCSTYPPTMDIFAPLRALSWAAIPYVCVRDGEGNRWFMNLQVPTGRNVRGGEQWFADVVMTEIAAVPSAIRTSDPQPTIDALFGGEG